MKFLLDTHVLLWHMNADTRLQKKTISEIENPKNQIYLSKATLWEISIKVSLKKLSLKTSILGLEDYLIKNSFIELDFGYQDLQTLAELPFHHGDPFDRLIISQAINNDLTIISTDKKFQLYPVQLL